MRNCPRCGQAWPEWVYEAYSDGECARCNLDMLTCSRNLLLEQPSDG